MINDKMVTKEKFGDLSRPLGDQFTHPTIASWWTVSSTVSTEQSRVWDKDGAGEIYCPDISSYNSCAFSPTTPQQWSEVVVAPYNALVARLCALCPTQPAPPPISLS